VDAVLTGLRCELQMTHTMLLWLDEERGQLTAIGSRGYEATGIGSDVALGEGAIGVAAATGQAVRITDLGRSGRLSAAVARLPGEEDVTRRIALPGLVDALSQIAVPVAVRGEVRGVLFAESVARLAFFEDDEAALMVIAGQAGMVLALIEAMAFDDEAEARPRPEPLGNPVQVVYYDYDHSVFIDGQYVIKGFAGRLLFYMMEQWRSLGRVEFSNREIRLETLLGLPLIKDNLETRLLLLRRRLEEKKFPVRLVRAGRGRVVLQVGGKLELSTVGDGRIDGGPH
jgi:adenylate cyclase